MKGIKHQLSLLAATGSLTLISLVIAVDFWTSSVATLPVQANTYFRQEYLSLSPVSPDEPAEDTLNERFSVENSLERIAQIRDALSSFSNLTEKSKATLGESATAQVGNTDWETQNLGFPNWVGSVEGTIRKQDYQNKQLELELARKQYEDGEITKAVLDEKAASYQRAEQEFQDFWNSFNVAD